MSEDLAIRVEQEARKFIGTPFRHSGRSTLGIDCVGLLYMSFSRAGIPSLPKTDGREYSLQWFKHTKEERLYNAIKSTGHVVDIPIEEKIKKGDILLFRLFKNTFPAHHSGIAINENFFIHVRCSLKKGNRRVDLDLFDPFYYDKLAYILRHKDLL
jgi:cell wall-associated NlpC family hydrolase